MYKLHNTKVVSVTLSVLTAVFAVSVIAYAATSIGTNLSVDGTATVGTTLGVTGATTFTGDVTANGSGTFGNAVTDIFLFTGDLHASTTALFTEGFTTYGAVVFNEDGGDNDLRIEGDNVTNLLMVDASTDRIGIASTTPSNTFSVQGNSYVSGTGFFGSTLTATSSAVLARDGGTVGIASSTPAQELGVVGDIMAGSAATTTLQLTTSSATIGGCIELKAVNGTTLRIYATSSTQTGTLGGVSNLMVEAGRCQ